LKGAADLCPGKGRGRPFLVEKGVVSSKKRGARDLGTMPEKGKEN